MTKTEGRIPKIHLLSALHYHAPIWKTITKMTIFAFHHYYLFIGVLFFSIWFSFISPSTY